jgi:predicted NBD/HSP70 family sugar kinase
LRRERQYRGDEASSAAVRQKEGGVVEIDYQIYVGIDWGSEAHQACVLDRERRIVAERSFEHAGDGVAGFAQWLRELADDPEGVAIAIEIPRGA